MSGFKVAVAGATGNVGREMLSILAERRFPVSEVVALASTRSIGRRSRSATGRSSAEALEHYDFSDTDICLMSAGGAASKEFSPRIGARGCVVIDNSSAWRMDPDVPLIVPEVNAAAAKGFAKKNIIANPNCSTAQLVVALKPLHDFARRSSGWWWRPISRSRARARRRWTSCSRRPAPYSCPIRSSRRSSRSASPSTSFPQIDVFMDDGSTKEEWKMVAETKKILDPKIKLTATCVRVPVFIGHSEAVNIEFEKPISADEARDILRPCARLPGHRPARARRLHHAPRGGGRGRDLYFPHPRGPDDRERPQPLVRVGQPAQGRGAQRGPDRGSARRIAAG